MWLLTPPRFVLVTQNNTPLYTFQHPITKEVKEIVQRMSEPHTFTDDKGIVWERLFVIPQMAINSIIDPNDKKSFVDKTRDKNYNLGELWSLSQECSEKREGMSGVDEVRVKAEQSYEKRTKGSKHPHRKKQEKFLI